MDFTKEGNKPYGGKRICHMRFLVKYYPKQYIASRATRK